MKKNIFASAIILLVICTNPAFGQGTFTAIANGSWTTSGSWSHTGVDGDNIPDANDIVTIPNLRTITMPTGVQQVASLTIQSGGTLNMNNPGAILDIFPNGGLLQVNLGGTIADNSTTTEINFLNNSSFIINGIVQADLLEFEGANQTVTITGNGTLLVGRFNVFNTNITVHLNTTGSFGSTNPFTVANANFTLDGTGTIGLGGGGNGDFNINASGISIGCTMTISDDMAVIANSSGLTITNGGSISVSDDLRVGPNADGNNFNLTINNGGALTISSEVLFDEGDTFTRANNFTLNNSGTLSIIGQIDINSATTASFANSNLLTLGASINNAPAANPATFTNNASATFNLAGDIDNDVALTFSATGNTVNYTSNGGTDVEDPIGNTYHNLTVGGTGNRLLRDNIIVGGNLTIQNSAIINSNTRDISIAGNWTNSSSNGFTEGVRTVTFNGSANQTISTSLAAGETFYNLTLNKATGGVLLTTSPSTDVNVAGTMTFTNGILTTTSNELLTFNDESLVAGGSNTSFVDGPVRKLGEDAFVFPTGDGGFWSRIGISLGTAGMPDPDDATSIIAQYFAAAAPNSSNLGAGVARVSAVEYWQLTRSGNLANGNVVTLYWQDGTRSGIDDITPASNLFVARFDGTNWVTAGPGSIGGGSTPTTGNILSANLSAANINTVTRNYTFGTNVALPTNPLPIELLDFTASLKLDKVELKWSTATELNNDFFTLERAVNIEEFEAFGEPIDGKGTTSVKSDYMAFDETPIYGRSYYRLKQTDFDGAFTYSPVKTIDYDGPKFTVLKVYPNPSGRHQITIEVNGLKDQPTVPVQIFNIQGQKVFDQILDVTTPGTLKQDLEFSSPLKQGLYIIKAGQTLQLTQKLIVD